MTRMGGNFMKNKIRGNQYVYWGLTLFCALIGAILFTFVISKFPLFITVIGKILSILSPIFIGIMIAYLLNPLVRVLEKYVTDLIVKKCDRKEKFTMVKKRHLSRGLAIFITYLVAIVFIGVVIWFVIPNILDSLNVMIRNIPIYINNIYDYLKDTFGSDPETIKLVENINTNITNYIGNLMVPSIDTILANITSGISSVLKWTINTIIGMIVAVYLLYDKDQFIDGLKKIFKVTLPKKAYDTTMTTLGYIDRVFGGFLVAKIIDSLLIGIITFIVSSIFKIPYALIIAVIVGITNIIPYFGPFIGAVPCIVLLLLINPGKALTFAIIILIIQQFDGNILGPKLIGNKTGMKSFWVLFAILLFGGLFGFAGMIFGVPVFAVIYSVIKTQLDKMLAKKNGD